MPHPHATLHVLQDYNRSVLTTLTIQNVAANRSAWATRRQALGAPAAGTAAAAATQAAGEEPGAAAGAGASGGARYFAGSWGMLCALLEERGLARTYDLVLTAGGCPH